MDPTDSLLKQETLTSKLGLEEDTGKPKPAGVKLDIVNECQMFLKAEDGGGDTHLNENPEKGRPNKPAFATSTPDQKKDSPSENQIVNSNPECDIEDKPAFATSTPDQKKDSPSENQIVNSNPECDIEAGVLELPTDGLPETVTVLEGPNGGKVYVVGTAHFSLQSQEDVARVIQEVQPHIVMVELCEQRTNILLLDEEVILQEAKNINIKKIRATIKQNGMINGLMYILLLNMSAHFTRELGMAPGGEFRRAMAEAKKLPNCHIHLGDRPIDVTLKRAIASLSWGQTLRFVWHLLTSNKSVSVEEVEKCKQKAMLDDMLEEMAEEFPTLKQVFVAERDMFLCHSLQVAAIAVTNRHAEPCRIVGVVGIGHVGGIVDNWGKVQSEDIPPLLKVPPPSRSTRVLRVSVRAACLGLVLYGAYRLFPRRWLP